MFYPKYTLLIEYTTGQRVPCAEQVANTVKNMGLDIAEYFWADMYDDFNLHRIVIWKKTEGTHMPVMAVFEPDEEENGDIGLYVAGTENGDYDAELACQDLYGALYFDDEYQEILDDIKDRENQILMTGEYWLSSIKGLKIPDLSKTRPDIWDIDWFSDDDDSVPDTWVFRKI